MSGPVVAEKTVNVSYSSHLRDITVFAGLHYIRGNELPYFSLTFELKPQGGRRVEACGAGHAEILRHFPQFADIAALHLSDIYGVPNHAAANGWYWLCGAVEGGHGERYHGGNSGTPKTTDECLKIFADHVRVDLETAAALRDRFTDKTALIAWIETQLPRYKAEADAARARHGLVVYGDAWEGEKAA